MSKSKNIIYGAFPPIIFCDRNVYQSTKEKNYSNEDNNKVRQFEGELNIVSIGDIFKNRTNDSNDMFGDLF